MYTAPLRISQRSHASRDAGDATIAHAHITLRQASLLHDFLDHSGPQTPASRAPRGGGEAPQIGAATLRTLSSQPLQLGLCSLTLTTILVPAAPHAVHAACMHDFVPA